LITRSSMAHLLVRGARGAQAASLHRATWVGPILAASGTRGNIDRIVDVKGEILPFGGALASDQEAVSGVDWLQGPLVDATSYFRLPIELFIDETTTW